MDGGKQVVVAGIFLLAVAAWLIAAPTFGLPVGVLATDGSSMGDPHDQVFINVWVHQEPKIGDVVIFEHSGDLVDDTVAHRVVDKETEGYVTKGDANNFRDQNVRGVEHVTDDTLMGVVLIRIQLETVFKGAGFTAVASTVAILKEL